MVTAKKIFISVLIVGAIILGLFNLTNGLNDNYGVTVASEYQDKYEQIENSTNEVYDMAETIRQDVENLRESSSFVDMFYLNKDTLKMIIVYPIALISIIMNLITIVASMIPIEFVMGLLIGGVVFTIVFIILKILLNRGDF